jgi:hypothetical protein
MDTTFGDFLSAPGFSSHAKGLQKSAAKLREGLTAFGPSEGYKKQQKTNLASDIEQGLRSQTEGLIEGMQGKMGGRELELAKEIAEAGAEATAAGSLDVERKALEVAQAEKMNAEKRLDAAAERRSGIIEAGLGAATGRIGEWADKQDKEGKSSLAGVAKIAQVALPLIFCWVAREVVPDRWRHCRTYILFGAPKWFLRFYLKHGPSIASWLRRHPWAKAPLVPLFRYFAWRGKKMGEQEPKLIELQADLL